MSKEEHSGSKLTSQDLYFNALIGFLSILLMLLLISLFTRIVYPRILTERNDKNSGLISQIIQIEVLNGCGVNGVANNFTNILRTNGFDVVDTGNFDNFDVQQSMVISRSGSMEHAYQIARVLGIEDIHVLREESDDYYLDATIVIGADYESLNID
jgi:hypothetical protein